MVTATLRSVGGSVMMAVPRSMLDDLGLAANAKVGLSVQDGRLIVEPQLRPRYSLAELIAECDPSAPAGEDELDWDAAPAVGREAL